MKKPPQISEAEYEVMRVIWTHSPINTNDVTKILTQTTNWNPKTIQTMLKRLVQKGAITYEKDGRVFVYTPLVQKNEYLDMESHHFLSRYYNGTITSMLASFIDNDKLTENEIEELRSILSRCSQKGVDSI